MSYFNKFLISPIAFIAMNVILSQQAHAWQHYDGSFLLHNNTGEKITVFKTHSYQMDTNNNRSASQVIQGVSSGVIDFWAQYQANGYDIDDAMDFQVNDKNNKKVGSFTLKVTQNGLGFLYVQVVNASNFVYMEQNAILANALIQKRQGIIYLSPSNP